MEKYRVEHWHWVDGSGWSYETTIDNTDDCLTAEELGEAYGDYCENDGDEIHLIDNETNETISVYEKTDN